MEYTPVYLIVFSNSDESVGIFEAQYKVETPFLLEDIQNGTEDKESLDFFREEILKTYKEFDCISAEYDYILEEESKKIDAALDYSVDDDNINL